MVVRLNFIEYDIDKYKVDALKDHINNISKDNISKGNKWDGEVNT